jgi:hypothetical protein
VSFDKDRRNIFQVNHRSYQCEIYGLSDPGPACDATGTGKVVFYEKPRGYSFKTMSACQDFSFEALRVNEVPLPDGRYALLTGGSHKHPDGFKVEYMRCAVGEIIPSPSNAFKKVAVIDIIDPDGKFYFDLLPGPMTLA